MARIISFLLVGLLFAVNANFTSAEPLSLLTKPAAVQGAQVPAQALNNRAVVVTFFASWCPPCTDEFAALNEIRQEFPIEKLTIVAVNLFEKWGGNDNPQRMARFLKRTNPKFYVIDGSERIQKDFGNIERIPTLVVYDRKGIEVWRFVHKQGATKMSATAEDIRTALKVLD